VAAPLSRGDVRLCRFPPPDKQRPVLVLTRSSAIQPSGYGNGRSNYLDHSRSALGGEARYR